MTEYGNLDTVKLLIFVYEFLMTLEKGHSGVFMCYFEKNYFRNESIIFVPHCESGFGLNLTHFKPYIMNSS